VKNAKSGAYACPTGFKACQESWLGDPAALEKVICIADNQDRSAACPITSFAFTLDHMTTLEASQYEKVQTQDAPYSQIYISRSALSLPIDKVKVSASTPCWSPFEEARGANQAAYFAEMSRSVPTCSQENPANYQKLSLDSSWPLTEYSLQEESGVLRVLRKAKHYTYSFFPDDMSKMDIPLNVY